MRNKLILAALSATALALPSAGLAQNAPAAVVVLVDSNRVFAECNACKTAQASLQSQINALQTRQQTLSSQLQPEGEAIQHAADALNGKQPDAALKARATAFQQKEQQAQDEIDKGKENLQSIHDNILRQFAAKFNPAVGQVMAQHGANLAVDVGSTIAHSPAVDVTDAVIAAVNASLPSISVTPLPQEQPSTNQTQGR